MGGAGMTLKFDLVHTASWVNPKFYGADALSFGSLEKLGLLRKGYQKGGDPECMDIVWTVVGDVEFTDSHGNHWQQGDVIVWER